MRASKLKYFQLFHLKHFSIFDFLYFIFYFLLCNFLLKTFPDWKSYIRQVAAAVDAHNDSIECTINDSISLFANIE